MVAAISYGLTGLAGWRVLQRSEALQIEAVSRDPVVTRATDYFRENVGGIASAEDLVSDYRMLSVALGAFGLEDDVANRAFLQKVLESDLDDSSSLVNRLSDKRYRALAEAFGFGGSQHATDQGFADEISDAYIQREFERRVGEGDESFRLALNARRELSNFAERETGTNTLWYEMLGNTPLRRVFEGALGFDESIGNLSIDRQLDIFKAAFDRRFGTEDLTSLVEDGKLDNVISSYLLRSQLKAAPAQNRYSTALALLGG